MAGNMRRSRTEILYLSVRWANLHLWSVNECETGLADTHSHTCVCLLLAPECVMMSKTEKYHLEMGCEICAVPKLHGGAVISLVVSSLKEFIFCSN